MRVTEVLCLLRRASIAIAFTVDARLFTSTKSAIVLGGAASYCRGVDDFKFPIHMLSMIYALDHLV